MVEAEVEVVGEVMVEVEVEGEVMVDMEWGMEWGIEVDMEVDMEVVEEDTAAAGFLMPGSLRTGIHPIRLLRKSHPPLHSVQRTSTAPIVAVRF